MAEASGDAGIVVTLVYSPRERAVIEINLSLAAHSTVADAIGCSGLLLQFPELDVELAAARLVCGVWGRKASATQALRDGDRVEICRPLKVDPKVARRLRFAGQGVRATGLFAKRRPGAKPGY